MLGDLLAHPGVEEVCELRGRFGLMAFHGGSLERGTDTIAAAAAERSGSSLYAIRQPPDLSWHLPSVAFDPAASPALARFVDHVEGALGDGFSVVDDLEAIPEKLRGQHPRNPVNLPRLAGAQLELPPRVRPGTGAPTFRVAYETAVVDALAAVAAAWPGDGMQPR